MRNHTIWLHCYERRRNSLNNMVKILQSVCKIAENTISHAIICIRWELHPMKIWTKRSTKCSKVVGKTPINISTWTLIEGKLWNTKQIKYVFFPRKKQRSLVRTLSYVTRNVLLIQQIRSSYLFMQEN